MKCFFWSGLNAQQQKTAGEIAASSLALAKMELKRQGIILYSIRRKKSSLFFRKEKINFYDRVLIFRQLAVLIEAGITITDSFEILSKKQEKIILQTFLFTIKHKLESGKKLAEILRLYPQYFDELSCHLIEIGEHTGQLDKMLIKIANNQEKKWQLQLEIKSILFYPLLITLVSIVISLIMLVFIVPRFEELFQNFRPLPTLTVGIFLISKWIRHFFVGGILLFVMGLVFMIYGKKTLKNYLDTIMQKWPILRKLTQKILLARFAHHLALTVSAGMAITDALKIMSDTKPLLYANAIQHLHGGISIGQQIHKTMETHALFSPMMIQMVKVGEETGKLDYMLEKIALLYEAEINQWLQQFSRMLEPLIMLILGVLIGGLVIAMYLPIFKLGTVVNGHY